MRKSPIVLLSLAALAAGYSVFWFQKAEALKQGFLQSVANANTMAKAYDPDVTLLRYESVSVVGFPFDFTVRMEKPVMDIPFSGVLKNLAAQAHATLPPAVAAAKPLYVPPAGSPKQCVEELRYDRMDIAYNLGLNEFSVRASDDGEMTMLLDKTPHHTYLMHSDGDIWHFSTSRSGLATLAGKPDIRTFLSLPISVRFDSNGGTMTDKASGQLISSMGKASFNLTNAVTGGPNHHVTLGIEAKDAKFTPASDALVADDFTLFNDFSGVALADRNLPPKLSVYGDNTLKVALSYEGPVDMPSLQDPNLNAKLDIDNLDFKNALEDGTFQLHVGTNVEGDSRSGSLVSHARSTVTALYDQNLASQVTQLMAQAETRTSPTPMQAMAAQSLAKMGKPDEVTAALLPHFHDFGTVTLDIDAGVKGPNQHTAFLMGSSYSVQAFNWMAEHYGLGLKGKGGMPGGKPSADFTLTCTNCDALITDAGNYAVRVSALIARTQPGTAPFVTPGLVSGVRQFLHGLAETPEKTGNDLVLHPVLKETGDFTISGKPIMQVISLYSTTIAPQMAARQPSAPLPPMGAPSVATPMLAPPAAR